MEGTVALVFAEADRVATLVFERMIGVVVKEAGHAREELSPNQGSIGSLPSRVESHGCGG